MNSLGLAVFLVAVAAAHAGLLAAPLGAPIDSAAVISGPSGQIVRSGLAVAPVAAPVAAPLAVARAAPIAVARAAPLAVAPAVAPVVAPAVSLRAAQLGLELSVPAGSGLEGQWIPDINEKLYDDGSYKPQIYGL